MKVSDKITTLKAFLSKAHSIIIVGAMAYPFLKAKGLEIGNSICNKEDTKLAKKLIQQDKTKKIILPSHHVVAKNPKGACQETADQNIPKDKSGFDIGEKSLNNFKSAIDKATVIFWNGPAGFFENPPFNKGTIGLIKLIAKNKKAFKVAGGGDSLSALKNHKLESSFSHLSSGGGACLEYIEKSGAIPGIEALKHGKKIL